MLRSMREVKGSYVTAGKCKVNKYALSLDKGEGAYILVD